jgi:PhoH-like ATPase
MQNHRDASPKAYVVDTNVLVHDPNAIDILREGGNTLFIHWAVIHELDHLKSRPDIGLDARQALRRIEEIRLSGDQSLVLQRKAHFQNIGDLDRKNPDHQIIATAYTLHKDRSNKQVVKLISRDRPVRLLARELGLYAEDYRRDNVEAPKFHLREINVSEKEIDKNNLAFPFDRGEKNHQGIEENQGVVCFSDWDPISGNCEWQRAFAAIRKNDVFKIIPRNISALGLQPFSLNGNGFNWSQAIALAQLLDSDIQLVFLQGGAGSGKTLLALASAIEQRSSYKQIIVARPMVHLEDEDNMGFLPGDAKEKIQPWLRPIMQALSFLKEADDAKHKGTITNMQEKEKIDFLSLDYIRGITIYRDILIVDEAQNLTPHQVKTIITRAGMHTKVIFTGDLGQIDRRRRLDEKSSGLAHAIARMNGHSRVGVTNFKETVRSELAKLAEERL